jgi:signal transduction histidine kinase
MDQLSASGTVADAAKCPWQRAVWDFGRIGTVLKTDHNQVWSACRHDGVMEERSTRSIWPMSLAQQFMLGSLVVLVAGMAAVGAWVARQIEDGVIQRTAATTALYVDSLVTSSLQRLATEPALSESDDRRLHWLFEDTPLGQEVVAFQVWNRDGEIIFSTVRELEGARFPVDEELLSAFDGRVTADIGDLEGGELAPQALPRHDLLEIYSPVRNRETGEVIAVAEFYYATDDLRQNIDAALRRSWLVVGVAGLLIYLVLSGFVRRASDTISRQQDALAGQVQTLTCLLRQNEELHQRARGAAARAVALNERFLRRFSAELHDGPAQDISLALLRLDNVAAHHGGDGIAEDGVEREIGLIQTSLRRALGELRSTSSGLLLPQLGALTVAETVEHVVRGHRRRNAADVTVSVRDVPVQAPLASKIALYRIIQEALTNASRHAPGAHVTVTVTGAGDRMRVEIRDSGPGFDPSIRDATGERLGLAGMRERAESLGGEFAIASGPDVGTRVVAELPLREDGAHE